MSQVASTRFPAPSLDWLAPRPRADILVIGSPDTLPTLRAVRRHRASRRTRAGLTAVVAAAESLPFAGAQFDVVTVHQALHRLAPALALDEFARVLRPSGLLSVSYIVRDDTIPWVRRLVRLVREYDQFAMGAGYGDSSAATISQCSAFPVVDYREYRVWRPITREGMVNMVLAQPLAGRLDDRRRDKLASDVASLYDDAAPMLEPLRLPFALKCWRARVERDRDPDDDAVRLFDG